MSQTVIKLEGVFRVFGFKNDEKYGKQCGIAEVAEDFPQNFSLSLPASIDWKNDDVYQMSIVAEPQTLSLRAGGRMLKFKVKEVKVKKATVKVEIEK